MATKTENNKALWTVQVLLALVFLLAGGSKLVLPLEAMQGAVPMPGSFIRFIGVVEVTGSLGLLLPGIFRIRTYLTPIAAIGLVLIMSGATTITIESGMVGAAVIPAIVGSLAALIVFGRRVWLNTEAAAPQVLVRRLRAA